MSLNDCIAGTYCTYNQNVSYTNMENKSGEGYFLYPINSQSNVSLKSVKDFMLGLMRISFGVEYRTYANTDVFFVFI